MKRLLFICAAIVLLGGCSKGTSVPAGSQATAAAPGVPVQNPINFPLAQGSSVMFVKPFTQTVSGGKASVGILSSGAGTYSGNEVVAGSTQTLAELENWLRQTEKQPPAGYVDVPIPANLSQVRVVANKNGIDFGVFHDANKHGLLVLAMDPATAHAKLGTVLSLLQTYQAMPAGMRAGIDSRLKQRTGYSVSEFTQPGSPLGVAVGALNQFQGNNQRALILVEAAKQ